MGPTKPAATWCITCKGPLGSNCRREDHETRSRARLLQSLQEKKRALSSRLKHLQFRRRHIKCVLDSVDNVLNQPSKGKSAQDYSEILKRDGTKVFQDSIWGQPPQVPSQPCTIIFNTTASELKRIRIPADNGLARALLRFTVMRAWAALRQESPFLSAAQSSAMPITAGARPTAEPDAASGANLQQAPE